MTRILLSAGEASGDMHAAELAARLRERDGAVEMYGMGGPLMRRAGVDVLFDPTSISTVGFAEALRSLGVFRKVLRRLEEAMAQRPPDVAVLVDFPGFNLKLAEAAARRGVPIVYYMSPSAWAWGKGRAYKLARLGATICAVFPFEEAVYREAGAEVVYVGHPLVARVKPGASREELRRELGVGPQDLLVALLPGSRRQELAALLGPMLEAAAIIRRKRPEARFAVPVAHTLDVETVRKAVSGAGVPVAVVPGRAYDVMHAADAAIISMGTATLEAALLGLPHVACYRLSPVTYAVAKRLVRISRYAMPNIVAGKDIVPELLQDDVTGPRLAEAVLALLDPAARERVRAELAQVKAALGEGDAAGRAAGVILAKARAKAARVP
ncbi:MAG: lipid-A-disaccharide synthase [Limnochordales bacterium]